MKYLIFICWLGSFLSVHAQIPTDSLQGHYSFGGTLTDISGNSNDIVLGSGSYVSDRFGNDQSALLLDGVSDSLVLPILEFSPIIGDFAFSFWYKTNSPEIMNFLSSKQTPSDTTNNFEIQFSSHNSYYLEYLMQSYFQTFVYWNGSGISSNAIAEGMPGTYSKGDWSHFVITREIDTLRIYRNHSLTYLSIDQHYGGTLGDEVGLVFGASPYRFEGSIDDMRLYNRCLQQSEVDLLWFENKPFSFVQVKPTDAYVQGSNVLIYWEYDITQISDSIQVEYRINGGDWTPSVHSSLALENYTYIDLTYPPGTTFEIRVSDYNNISLTESTGAMIVSEYNWVEVSSTLPFPPKDGSGLLSFQDKMWLLGGWDPPFHPPNYTHSEVWSSADGVNWNFETTAPWPARHASAWLVKDDAMWVIGGDPQSGCLTDVWKSVNGIDWIEVNTAIPGYTIRNNPNYSVLNSELFLFGGEQCSGSPMNDVWHSADGVSWNQLPNASWSGRGMQINSCVDGSGQLWMLGGSNEGTRRSYNEVWKSSDGINWTLVNESAPWSGRYWHTVAWFDDKMWLLGGMATGTEMNDVWYSGDGIAWNELKSTTGNWPVGSRHAQSTTVFDNALWYMCGILTNNVWKIVNTTNSVGIDKVPERPLAIHAFPNPANEDVTLTFSCYNLAKTTIQIFSTTGTLVTKKEISALGSTCVLHIDLADFPSGVYFVKIDNQPNQTTKFIKL